MSEREFEFQPYVRLPLNSFVKQLVSHILKSYNVRETLNSQILLDLDFIRLNPSPREGYVNVSYPAKFAPNYISD